MVGGWKSWWLLSGWGVGTGVCGCGGGMSNGGCISGFCRVDEEMLDHWWWMWMLMGGRTRDWLVTEGG